MSTDAVFSGMLERPWVESDLPMHMMNTERVKHSGKLSSDLVLNIRSSIIGRDPDRGRGLLDGSQGSGGLEPTAMQISDGRITTDQFAYLCTKIIEDQCSDDFRAASHVIHFCPNHEITRYSFSRIWQEATRPDIHIRPGSSGWTGRLLAGAGTMYGGACFHLPPAGNLFCIRCDFSINLINMSEKKQLAFILESAPM